MHLFTVALMLSEDFLNQLHIEIYVFIVKTLAHNRFLRVKCFERLLD